MKKSALFTTLVAAITLTCQAHSATDEYGLTVNASHTISLFGTEHHSTKVTPFVPFTMEANYHLSSAPSDYWGVQSTETERTCELWSSYGSNAQEKVSNPSGDQGIMAPPRTCLSWIDTPVHVYGIADVYLSNDNRLDKPVVIVQPYHIDVEGSSYSSRDFYYDINQGGLATSLRSAGYDVILYRYREQDRGIEFNADGVKRLVEMLNNKPGVTSSSFIGLSMGGVATRFALREIEKTGSLNKVATFISFDAPHYGANFPRSILDNTNRLLDKVDVVACGEIPKCSSARKKLRAIKDRLETKTFKELIINTPSGSSDRSALLSKLASLGHVQTVPTLAITNGAQSRTQGAPSSKMTSHFKLHRPWYLGGSEYFKVYTQPSVDNVAGGYADFYQVFSDLIENQPHPITPYVTLGQQHSFVSTHSALAGSANNWDEVAAYPGYNEQHMTLTYSKARKIREWLDRYQN